MHLLLLLFYFFVCCAPPAPARAPEACTASYFGCRPNACRMVCRMASLPHGLSLARSAGSVERFYIRSKRYLRVLRLRISALCVSSVIKLRKGLSCFAMNDHREVIREVAMSFPQSFAAIGVAVNSCDVRRLGVLQGGVSPLMFICPLGLKKF